MYVREHWLEIRVEWFLEKKRALGRLCQIVSELINVPIFESRKEMLYPSTLLYSVQYMTGSFSSSWSLALLVLRTLLYSTTSSYFSLYDERDSMYIWSCTWSSTVFLCRIWIPPTFTMQQNHVFTSNFGGLQMIKIVRAYRLHVDWFFYILINNFNKIFPQ